MEVSSSAHRHHHHMGKTPRFSVQIRKARSAINKKGADEE